MKREPYTTREIAPGVLQLTDVMDDRSYLVVGTRAAVLVDTGSGYGDLQATVGKLTDLPLTVLLTHSHFDHVSGAYFFDEVRIAAQDDGQWEYEADLANKAYQKLVRNGTYDVVTPFGPQDGRRPRVRHVVEGDVFDLGGLTVEAVALPGHTPGSMGYLVRERRILLSGDAVTPIMCLFFERSLGIPTYQDTLQKMGGLPFDAFYTGHHDFGFAPSELPSFDACAAFALCHRGVAWFHTLLPELRGTVYLPPCDTRDVDSPSFRALIGPPGGL